MPPSDSALGCWHPFFLSFFPLWRRQLHLEFAEWNDKDVAKQADTVMLSYPLGVDMSPAGLPRFGGHGFGVRKCWAKLGQICSYGSCWRYMEYGKEGRPVAGSSSRPLFPPPVACGAPRSPSVRKNDLDYYANHTGNGPVLQWYSRSEN